MKKPDARRVLADRVGVNAGHDRAALIREGDPDGAVCEHQVVTTGRMVDRLFERGWIDGAAHQAATVLRDNFERAGLVMGKCRAVDLEASRGGGDPLLVADEDSWRAYTRAMTACRRWRRMLRAVVIDDAVPASRAELTELRAALDALARHYGILYARRS